MIILQTQNLTKKFSNGKSLQFPDVNLELGNSLLIYGPSGCGKTTLLHLLTSLIRPSSGEIIIDSTKLNLLTPSQRDKFRGKNIGICLQRPVFVRSLTVLENLMLTQKLAGVNIDKNKCQTLLAKLNLSHAKDQLTHTLSQGEQQRLGFLRAFINQAKIIFADEPSSSLDDLNADLVIQMLLEYSKEFKASLVVVSHDIRIKKFFTHQISLA